MLLLKKFKYFMIIFIIAGFDFIGNGIFFEELQVGAAAPAATEKGSSAGYIAAYYFHGNFRCANCKKIEQYSHEAIEKYFAKQLQSGQLIFNVKNIDIQENKHFIDDYKLFTRSLVIAEFKGGKQVSWKNLSRVWDYLNDKDKFYQYVQSEIQEYLEHL